MRDEKDPGSPAILLKDLDQAWMVLSLLTSNLVHVLARRTGQSILPNISGYFETVGVARGLDLQRDLRRVPRLHRRRWCLWATASVWRSAQHDGSRRVRAAKAPRGAG